MNRFENMETFIRVVETGSISAAADRAGVAKSAVSRRLKELEEHLGVQLFLRTTRRMNLTDSGRAYYHQCVRILEDVLEAELATSQAHGTLKGSLKVALPQTFGVMHMAPAINEFLLENPQIEFELDFNDRSVDLMQEGFDLAIRIAKLPDSSLIARRLAPIKHLLCASPAYLEKHGVPQTLDNLANHQCLVYSLIRDSEHWLFNSPQGEPEKVKIHPYLKTSSGEFLRNAAVDGLGLVYLPSFVVFEEIERGTLVSLLYENTRSNLSAYAIYPQTRHLSRRVRAFVNFLVKRFDGVPYWDRCLDA